MSRNKLSLPKPLRRYNSRVENEEICLCSGSEFLFVTYRRTEGEEGEESNVCVLAARAHILLQANRLFWCPDQFLEPKSHQACLDLIQPHT